MTYDEFLKLVKPEMLDEQGRFRGPDAGVNYQAEGMTPDQFYKFMAEQVEDPNARDGADTGRRVRGEANPNWVPGSVSTASGLLGNWGVPLAMIATPFAAGALGAAGATSGAVATPVSGGTAGVTSSALAPLSGTGLGASSLAPLSLGQMSAPLSAGEMASLATTTTGGSGSGLLGTVGQWAKDNPTLMKLAGAALGAAASGDSKQSTSSNRDPWAPAQPYLLQNLAQNQAMSDHYNRKPFSQEQQNAYQGLLNTVAQSLAGGQGLLGNAANFMNSRRGVLPTMQATPQAQAPQIDWSQYANIGRR